MKREVVYKLRAVDLAVLLECLYKTKDVQLDTTFTYEELMTQLDGVVEIREPALESMFYAAIELKETGKWRHPKGLTWEQWKDTLAARGLKFNDTYGYVND